MLRAFAVAALFEEVSAARVARKGGEGVSEDYVQKTVKGCTCDGKCEAGMWSFYSCDTCKTEEWWCGEFSATGYWDYCAYDATSWEDNDWQTKMNYWWGETIANTNRLPDKEIPSTFGVLTTSPKTSFDNYMRHAPYGREKTIHAIGSICKFKLKIGSNSPYTGLLGPGEQHGLIRMGNAVTPADGMAPGLGFKFPRSGVLSGDFVALNSLDFTHSGNFFGYNQSNHIKTAQGLDQAILVDMFEKASNCAYFVGLSDLTKYSQDGTKHANPRFPFKLVMVPTSDVQFGTDKKSIDGLHAELDSIPVGSKLYTVVACGSPTSDETRPDVVCGNPTVLGDMVTTSQCTTSDWGDRWWQVRHQRVEEDWQLNPEFYKSSTFDAKESCDNNKASPTDYPENCNIGEKMLASDA